MDQRPEIEYKGFRTIPRFDGFQVVADRPMSIASFIIRKDDLICVFAFGVGMLFRMAHDELTERELLNKLQQKIKDYIDGGKLTSLEEFTFEIEDGEFFETKNPRWWNKTLRLMYG